MIVSTPLKSVKNTNLKTSLACFSIGRTKNVLFSNYNKSYCKVQLMNQSQYNQLVQEVSKKNFFKRKDFYQDEYHILTTVYSKSGAMNHMPKWYPFGIFKIIATIVTFLFVGSAISKKCVSLLEEYDIFKPEDDEDDEDD